MLVSSHVHLLLDGTSRGILLPVENRVTVLRNFKTYCGIPEEQTSPNNKEHCPEDRVSLSLKMHILNRVRQLSVPVLIDMADSVGCISVSIGVCIRVVSVGSSTNIPGFEVKPYVVNMWRMPEVSWESFMLEVCRQRKR